MENKTATEVLFEKQQREIEDRIFKEKLLKLMKVQLDKATRAFYLHMGQHGKFQGLNQQLSIERVKLRDEMMKLRDIISNIGRDKVLMTDMTLSFVIQNEGNIVLRLTDKEIIDFISS